MIGYTASFEKQVRQQNEKLLLQLPRRIRTVGKLLGRGAEGSVWESGDKALKLTTHPHGGVTYRELEKLVSRFKQRPNPAVVSITEVGKISRGHHWYRMERLWPLSDEEVAEVARVEYYYMRNRNFPGREGTGLNHRKREFLRNLNSLTADGLMYNDFAYFNIMKNRAGEWKLIDIEGFLL